MKDSPARIDPEEVVIGRPTQTGAPPGRGLRQPEHRRAYAGALRRLDAWFVGRELDEVALAAYLAELHDAGRERLDGGRRSVLPCEARRSGSTGR